MKSLAQECGRETHLASIHARRDPHADQHRGLGAAPRPMPKLMKLVLHKRIGEVDEIGRAAVWLA
ncbi:MAG: hypothetical protein IPF60_20610 [Betaproteobacteria bacterium]|nr:hypothetical protein [Betaproteobacteria bacterium]